MKEIELQPAMEYMHKLDVDVIDFPEGDRAKARKRCGITLDYGWRDVERLRKEGMDGPAMLEYYRSRVYDLVRVNIAQDWVCVGGMDEVLAIVGRHLEQE